MHGARAKIELRSLSKSFETKSGSLSVLDDLNLDVAEAEFASIIGPSGCGKSTMFNIMAGLEPATNGEVLVDGRAAARESGLRVHAPEGPALPVAPRPREHALGLEIQGVSKQRGPRAGACRSSRPSVCRASRTPIRTSCPAACVSGPRCCEP